MNGFAGFLGRSLRGFRLVEFSALMVLLVMVLGVYLAKAAAGRERGDITAVQSQIEDEQHRLRLLQAEVARLEEPQRIERLAAMAGLAPTSAKHESSPEALGQIGRAALIPERTDKKTSSGDAQTGFAGHEATAVAAGAPR
jgi:cell division protein FtsL